MGQDETWSYTLVHLRHNRKRRHVPSEHYGRLEVHRYCKEQEMQTDSGKRAAATSGEMWQQMLVACDS